MKARRAKAETRKRDMIKRHESQRKRAILESLSVIRAAICGSARASATAPASPMWHSPVRTPRHRESPRNRSDHNSVRPPVNTETRSTAAQAPSDRHRHTGRTTDIERRQGRHLRQRARKHLGDNRRAVLVTCSSG
jgi:hypothetical protein